MSNLLVKHSRTLSPAKLCVLSTIEDRISSGASGSGDAELCPEATQLAPARETYEMRIFIRTNASRT